MKLADILYSDPTLEAMNRAMEERDAAKPPRASRLGMGAIGGSCSRKIWYQFRLALRERFEAKTLKNFEDGHAAELVQAERLRLVDGIKLDTIDPKTGKQFEYTDHNGHFVGKCDGKITGLLQAPKKLHIWEHKSAGEDKVNKLRKLIADFGEKAALKQWNPTYHAQAQLYMHYESTDRHYMTVSTPGNRDEVSCRTEYNAADALQLVAKAKRIIEAQDPPERVSNKADWYECRYCAFSGICHDQEMPTRGCRTCLHSTAIEDGQWHCERWGKVLTQEEQVAGCPAQKYLPSLVPGEVIDSSEKGVTYKMQDGSEWKDEE